jgi:hypothetical protein
LDFQGPITLTGALTVGDLQRANYFLLLRRLRVVRLLILMLIAAFLMLVLALMAPGRNSTDAPLWSTIFYNTIPFFVLVLFVALAVGFAPYRIAKKQFDSEILWRETATYRFDNDGLHVQRPSASSDLKWAVITEAFETRSLFLLHLGKRSAVVLPKRFFAGVAETHAWRTLIEANLKARVVDGGFLGRWC